MAQYAALQASRRSRTPSPITSRPTSARPISATRMGSTTGSRRPSASAGFGGLPVPPASSRPTSATPARSRPTSAVPGGRSGSNPAQSSGFRPGSGSRPGSGVGVVGATGDEVPDMNSGAAMAAVALAAASAWGADVPSPAHAVANDGIVTAPMQPMQGSGGSRPTSGRPLSGSARPLSASAMQRGQRPASSGARDAGAGAGAAADSALQQLLEEVGEGEEEAVPVEGEPSGLSLCYSGEEAEAAVHRDEAYDSFALDGGDEPPPLELATEDSQELKRKIFPPEIVAALDAANAARLEEIRGEWGRLLADVEARNARKLEALKRNQSAIDKYAQVGGGRLCDG